MHLTDNPFLLPKAADSGTEIKLVTVASPGEDSATIIFPGQTQASQKAYKYAFEGMNVEAGDQVYAVRISGTWVLIGGSISGEGSEGTTFYPSVSAEGVISWTNDGGKPNPQPVNIKGPTGQHGSSIWTAKASWSTPNYTFNVSDLDGPAGVTPIVGDLILRNYYLFTIDTVGATTVHCTDWANIRGPQGEKGDKGDPGDGLYAFEIKSDGHLYVAYESPEPPGFSINAAGHLIYTFTVSGGS